MEHHVRPHQLRPGGEAQVRCKHPQSRHALRVEAEHARPRPLKARERGAEGRVTATERMAKLRSPLTTRENSLVWKCSDQNRAHSAPSFESGNRRTGCVRYGDRSAPCGSKVGQRLPTQKRVRYRSNAGPSGSKSGRMLDKHWPRI
jgi:hypothetical protein